MTVPGQRDTYRSPVAWHRASEDGGPTVPFTWSAPGATNPYALVDSRIALAKSRREDYDAQVAEIDRLEAELTAALEQPFHARPWHFWRASIKDLWDHLTIELIGLARPARSLTHNAELKQARRDYDAERSDLRREVAAARADLRAMGEPDRELSEALLAKADLVLKESDEGHGEVARMLAVIDEDLVVMRSAEELLALVDDLMHASVDAFLQWSLLTTRRTPPSGWRLGIPDDQDLAQAVQLSETVDSHYAILQSGLTTLGLQAQITWEPPELTEPYNPWHVEARTRDLAKVLDQEKPPIKARREHARASALVHEAALERILSRPF